MRNILLQKRSLDLSRCIAICRTRENTTSQMKLITDKGEVVHIVEERRRFTNIRQYCRGQFSQQKQHQHAPLLSANYAVVNMNGKMKCVQHGSSNHAWEVPLQMHHVKI